MKTLMISIALFFSSCAFHHTDADAYDEAEPGEKTVDIHKDNPGSGMAPALLVLLKGVADGMKAAPQQANCVTFAVGTTVQTRCQ